MIPRPGDLLLGKLRVIRELGRGGMGQVFEVLHEFTRHRRALKVLHPEAQAEPEAAQRFLREASAAGRIGNAHIAETFDAGFLPDGSAFLLMELLDGVSVRQYLGSIKHLELAEAAAVVSQCCEALQAAHEAGIVHRDVKPDNLFLTGPNHRFVKVLDFGIARFVDVSETVGILGTPLYMAPEQATGRDVDCRTDIYALGVVLYELVTGALPWASGSVAAVLERVASGALPPLRETVPSVDAAFADVVSRCMAFAPAARFQTALELHQALARWAALPELTPSYASAGLSNTAVRAVAAPATMRRAATPLPTFPGTFVGRREELDRLQRELDAGRLLVVVGAGGVGKSRTSLEALRRNASSSIVYVDCAELVDARGLVSALARCLEVPLGAASDGELSEEVERTLAERGDILLVDNVEHLLPQAEELLERWLARAPALKVVVTSQRRMGPSARHFELGPLREGVELLVERVRAVKADFTSTAGDAAALGAIVDELDGLPLALELAASRLTVMSPLQLLDRIKHEQLAVLSSQGRNRRSALRSSLDWSWNLLSDTERQVLAQLSVFRPGFTLDDAEAVVQATGTVDAVQSLMARSLMRAIQPGGSPTRLALLNNVRLYAEHQLEQQPTSADEVRRRHASHYARRADVATSVEAPPDAPVVLDLLQAEQPNLSAALRWALRQPALECAPIAAKLAIALDPLMAATSAAHEHTAVLELAFSRLEAGLEPWEDLALALGSAYLVRDRLEDAAALAERVMSSKSPLRRARAALIAAARCSRTGQIQEGLDFTRRGEAAAHEAGARWLVGRLLASRSSLSVAVDARESLRFGEQALEIHRETNDRRFVGISLGNLGANLSNLGDVLRARNVLLEAIAVHQSVGNKRSTGIAYTNLGILALDEGSDDDAEQWLLESLALHREVGNHRHTGVALIRLAACALLRGDFELAVERAVEAESSLDRVHRKSEIGLALAYHALALCGLHRVEEGRVLLDDANKLLEGVKDLHASGAIVVAHAGPAFASGQYAAAREAMRQIMTPHAGEAALSSRSDEVRLALRCVASVIRAIEKGRFRTRL